MSVPMVYLTYGLNEDLLTPYTEIKVDPIVENNIDNELNDKEVDDDNFDDECKDQTGTYQIIKKSCSPMEMSSRKENQKVN